MLGLEYEFHKGGALLDPRWSVYPQETPRHTRTARAQPPAAHRRWHSCPNHHIQDLTLTDSPSPLQWPKSDSPPPVFAGYLGVDNNISNPPASHWSSEMPPHRHLQANQNRPPPLLLTGLKEMPPLRYLQIRLDQSSPSPLARA